MKVGTAFPVGVGVQVGVAATRTNSTRMMTTRYLRYRSPFVWRPY